MIRLLFGCFLLLSVSNSFADNKLYPMVLNGKVCYIDKTGDVIISPEGIYNTHPSSTEQADYDTDYTIEYFTYRNQKYKDYKFPHYARFNEGKATFEINNRFWFIFFNSYKTYGVMNSNGEILKNDSDTIINQFSEDYAVFVVQSKEFAAVYDKLYGYTDSKFNVIIDADYEYASNLSDGAGLVRKDDKYGFVDMDDKLITPIIYDAATEFSGGLAGVKKGDKWGFINKSGEVVIDFKYELVWKFSDGIAPVFNEGVFRYINKTGEFINDIKFKSARSFSEGLAKVKEDDYFGFINTDGNYAISPKIINCLSVSEGLIPYQDGRLWGYLDTNGDISISPKFDFARQFDGELAIAWYDGKQVYINKKGEIVTEIRKNTINFFQRLFN